MPDRPHRHGVRWLHRLLLVTDRLLCVIVAAFTVLLLVAFPLWLPDLTRKVPLPCQVNVPEAAWPALEATADSTVRGMAFDDLRGALIVRIQNPWFHWLGLLSVLMLIMLATVTVRLLRQIVGSLVQGDVFNHANARRLRWLGLVLVVGAVVEPLFGILLAVMATRGVTAGGAPLTPDLSSEMIDWTAFTTAWIVLILSEVFRQGAELRDDQSLTV